ncbi:MAG: LON peptidase substrate-binding domain-containing protein [Firmicutes bacterium]|nr:LON peptidase substrate-binding domain-containing protein [Bacillota bacterium]
MVEANFPLIPLNAVLFPGGTLSLHIFEKRYRQLIAGCLDRDAPFGVVLIREGREVGGPCVPFTVGTTARLTDSVPLPDGRMNITAVGVRRFQIVDYGESGPYPMGLVEFLEEEAGEVSQVGEAAREAGARYTAYLNLARTVGRTTVPTAAALPEDPVQLSWAIARGLSADLRTRQELLECPTAADRLRREVEVLAGAERRLRQRHMGEAEATGG